MSTGPITVDGVEVRELYLTILPAAFLITKDAGQHEFTRLHYDGDGFRASERRDGKIGPGVVHRVVLDTAKGAFVVTSRGTVFVPMHRLEATWV